eukprot:CAMPEP_0172679132 /NCGR_PEP_ID=MMETSP1074-20121228/15857_1 /TAXON_ID=2916 /ORGANISM="Ceratium fusus, Strain PA161109" /LENGTH=96 /DNA_ID=CAMNT_0013497259 /DNA_START=1016 /DNA_END=1304 /DNA_ORIENTATION=-
MAMALATSSATPDRARIREYWKQADLVKLQHSIDALATASTALTNSVAVLRGKGGYASEILHAVAMPCHSTRTCYKTRPASVLLWQLENRMVRGFE